MTTLKGLLEQQLKETYEKLLNILSQEPLDPKDFNYYSFKLLRIIEILKIISPEDPERPSHLLNTFDREKLTRELIYLDNTKAVSIFVDPQVWEDFKKYCNEKGLFATKTVGLILKKFLDKNYKKTEKKNNKDKEKEVKTK